jgi:IS30 family transposase
VNGFIRQDWSPEQIAGRLKKDHVVDLHHETIYQYILADKRRGGDLYQHLRHQKKPTGNVMGRRITTMAYHTEGILMSVQLAPTNENV